jgi:peptidyl-prolyl cis-trans isomerase B (cyclophilin B)
LFHERRFGQLWVLLSILFSSPSFCWLETSFRLDKRRLKRQGGKKRVRSARIRATGAKMKLTLICCCLLGGALCLTNARAQTATPQTSPKSEENNNMDANNTEVAVLKTSDGEMVVKFWPDVAPKTVENFKKLARQGFYDGTAFHRIIKGFMIQGGDPNTKDLTNEDRYGTGGPGYSIPAEFNDRPHVRGVISMARSSDPNSAGSQFFICLGTASSLNHQYTAFGELIKGLDVLDKIGNTPVAPSSMGEMSKPTTRVALESVKIVPADSIKSDASSPTATPSASPSPSTK